MPNAYMCLFAEFLENLRSMEGGGVEYWDSVDQMVVLLLAERRVLQIGAINREDEDTLDDLPIVKETDHDGTGSDPDAG